MEYDPIYHPRKTLEKDMWECYQTWKRFTTVVVDPNSANNCGLELHALNAIETVHKIIEKTTGKQPLFQAKVIYCSFFSCLIYKKIVERSRDQFYVDYPLPISERELAKLPVLRQVALLTKDFMVNVRFPFF